MLALLLLCAQLLAAPLTEAEYVALGLPAASRTWMGADYTTLAKALQELPNDQLPDRQHPVFVRLVAQDNLSVQGPPDVLLGELAAIQAGAAAATMRYLAAMSGGAKVDAELLALEGFSLRWMVRQLEVLETLIASQPPGFMDDPARQLGMAQVRGGAATVLTGALMSLEGWKEWEAAPLLAYGEELAVAWPRVFPWLEAPAQAELQGRLSSLVKAMPQGPLRDRLAPLTGA